jgi:hypothetical protein
MRAHLGNVSISQRKMIPKRLVSNNKDPLTVNRANPIFGSTFDEREPIENRRELVLRHAKLSPTRSSPREPLPVGRAPSIGSLAVT